MTALICISLGGSHLQIGVIDGERYVGDAPIDWRASLARKENPDAGDLAHLAFRSFLDLLGLTTFKLGEDYSLGIAFPGPMRGGRWYSNNLTEDFKSGIELPGLLRSIFETHGIYLRQVICKLDAQADAGAEVYHPLGQLSLGDDTPTVVINIATGIAAGLVASADSHIKGRVLSSDEDFAAFLGDQYDKGSGQIGRHILFRPLDGTCLYDFQKNGGIAFAPGTVRLSEYLSGPALVSRFEFLKREALPRVKDRLTADATFSDRGSNERFCEQLILSNNRVRRDGGFPIRQLIDLLNLAEVDAANPLHEYASWFRNVIADDFSSLLSLLRTIDGWRMFTSKIVFTGGVGQNLFASGYSDFFKEAAFRSSEDVEVRRSVLSDGCERAAYYFYALAKEQ
jgi:hypothetical protein